MKPKLQILAGIGIIAVLISATAMEKERVYEISLVVDRDHSLRLEDIRTYNWYVTNDSAIDETSPDVFRAQLTDNSRKVLFTKYFRSSFIILSDPPQELNQSMISIYMEYSPDAKYLMVYYKDENKLNVEIQEGVCNNDGICNNYETYYSCPGDCTVFSKDGLCVSKTGDGGCDPDCLEGVDLDCSCPDGVCEEFENYLFCPQDCPSGSEDGYCDKVDDELCDSDCAEGVDPDCKVCNKNNICEPFRKENHGNCPEDCPSGLEDIYCDRVKDGVCDPDCKPDEDPDCRLGTTTLPTTTVKPEEKEDLSSYLPYILAVIIIIAIIILIQRRQRKTRPESKKSEEEEKLRYWIEGQLRAGEDPELLKKALEKQGSNPAMVDEIMQRL